MASYDSQVAYYEQKIKENPEWELAKIMIQIKKKVF